MARTRSGPGGGVARGLVLVVAVLLAGAATAAVVLSEDPQTLRLAAVGALWAFVLAALVGPRRRAAGDADGGAGGPAPSWSCAGRTRSSWSGRSPPAGSTSCSWRSTCAASWSAGWPRTCSAAGRDPADARRDVRPAGRRAADGADRDHPADRRQPAGAAGRGPPARHRLLAGAGAGRTAAGPPSGASSTSRYRPAAGVPYGPDHPPSGGSGRPTRSPTAPPRPTCRPAAPEPVRRGRRPGPPVPRCDPPRARRPAAPRRAARTEPNEVMSRLLGR